MKNIYTIIFLLAVVVPASAQFSVGIKTGLALANTTAKTKYTSTNKSGLAAGITVMNTLGKNVSVQGDLLYVQKGYNHQICNQCYDKLITTFVEVPINIRYSFYLPKLSQKLDNLKAHASGGLYFSKWLDARYETKLFDTTVKEAYQFSGEKRVDFGPNFGAGLEYTLFAGALLLDCRYSIGLVDMGIPGSGVSAKNRTLIFSLSYIKSF